MTLATQKNHTPDLGPAPLSGIIPPMITPLKGRDDLDHEGLERLIEHLLAGGVHGLFILGTSGEAPSLSYRLRRELIDAVCRQVRHRVPVLVGVTDTSFVEALALAGHAANAGAQAVVSSTPYYFSLSQPELAAYFQLFARESALPLYLYNIPQMTGVEFEPETLKFLIEIEKIVGIKDSSADFAYFQKVLKLKALRPDLSVLVGHEHLLAEAVRLGGDGGINAGANFCPALFVELYDAVKKGDRVRETNLQQKLLQIGKIYSVGSDASSFLKGIKCACSLLGLCDDLMAEPLVRFQSPERERVSAILDSAGLLARNTKRPIAPV
jgi:4-hydroxy-tetrahydrodipicolinate synthase